MELPQPLRKSQVDQIGEFNQKILDTTKGSLFFPSFRRIEGGFSRLSIYTSADETMNYISQPHRQQSEDDPTEDSSKRNVRTFPSNVGQ